MNDHSGNRSNKAQPLAMSAAAATPPPSTAKAVAAAAAAAAGAAAQQGQQQQQQKQGSGIGGLFFSPDNFTVKKNGILLGRPVTSGLTCDLCWAVTCENEGNEVRIKAVNPEHF